MTTRAHISRTVELAAEEWRPVRGHEGAYEVSNFGRVRSIDRIGKHSSGAPMKLRARELKVFVRKEHCRVDLCMDGKRVPAAVHRLVASAFLGDCPSGHEVRHLDGDGTNNTASNLLYGTRKENENDKVRHGKGNRGERCGTAKLTEDQVRELRSRRSAGEPVRGLAARYGVSERHIRKIASGERWGWM